MSKTVTHQDLKSYFGKQDHLMFAQSVKFSDLIFELLSEEKPTAAQSKVFELILNLSIDHGPETPSAIKTIAAAQEGRTISEAVAEGILQINDTHGGAIEPAMRFFYMIKNEHQDIKSLVKEYLDGHKLIGGFGHRIYKDTDPRAELILDKLKESGFDQEYVELADKVREAINESKGKSLPLNIDGAIAVALCTFGWPPNLSKSVFIIARAPGLCGQYLNNAKK